MLLTNYGFKRNWAVFTGRNNKIFHCHENKEILIVSECNMPSVEKKIDLAVPVIKIP